MDFCSFCSRPRNEVRRLYQPVKGGPAVCNRCLVEANHDESLEAKTDPKKEEFVLKNPREMYAYLQEHVISQDDAKKSMAVAVYQHYKRREALKRGVRLDVEIAKSNILLMGPSGCHRKGQKVIMFDGTLRVVEDIRVGDLLMGPDSQPRKVLQLVSGNDSMREVTPVKGDPWVVNADHILTLVRTSRASGKYKGRARKYRKVCELVDVSVSEWETWSRTKKSIHKLFRSAVEFTPQLCTLPLDPYFLGVLLGDGSTKSTPRVTTKDPEILRVVEQQAKLFGLKVYHSLFEGKCPQYIISGRKGLGKGSNPLTTVLRNLKLQVECGSKFIPHIYKTASKQERLALLAGLMDTDGHKYGQCCFDFTSKSKVLVDDVAFVARSLGFAAYPKKSLKKSQNGTEGLYYRLNISGDTHTIPVKIAKKQAGTRRQAKSVLHTGFTTRLLPAEDFYGFVLDSDHRYLLDDFTVTHNCGKTEIARTLAKMLNVPFYVGDTTKLTMSGYVGDDVESLIQGLLAECSGDVEKAQWGVIFLDEFDKLARKSGRGASGYRDVTGEGVQQALLKIIEGCKINVPRHNSKAGLTLEHDLVDTSNILFICAGSFAGIEDIVKSKANKDVRVGFGSDRKKDLSPKEAFELVDEETLLEFGIIPELLGRIPVHTSVFPLTEEEMVRILTEPKNALIKQYRALYRMEDIDLVFEPEALTAIGKEAKSRPTGARALRTIVESILKPYSFDLPGTGEVGQLVITKEVVESGAPATLVPRKTAATA